MKKLVLTITVVALGFTVNAQNFNGGVTVGFATGDFGDYYSLNLGLDLNALWEVSDDFNAGLATGYNHSTLDSKIDGKDFSYMPLAGSARFNASDDFQIGADLGYAIAISDGGDGGFYYRPMIGYNVGGNTQITASYRGISVDGGSFSTINFGVNFGL
jgi:hypothetical protein